jgi:hypothetical protein
MSQKPTLAPPRLASWLLDLFTAPSQSEEILGDLLEEFTTAVSTTGSRGARRWYWRQVIKTVAHLASAEFRTSPATIIATAFGGYLLLMCAVQLADLATGKFLGKFQVYYYVSPRFVWWIYAVAVERVICPMFVGWIATAISKRREMATATLLSAILAMVGLPLQLGGGLLWFVYVTMFADKTHMYVPVASFSFLAFDVIFQVLLGLLPPCASLIGAVIRRQSLSPERPPVSA